MNKLAKPLSKLVKLHVPLPHAFIIKSSVHMIDDLRDIPINENTKFASFDIANMYSNVPTKKSESIIKFMSSQQSTDDKITEELI